MESNQIKILKLEDDSQIYGGIKKLRAGIYARYSCIGNSPYSCDEQIERIRYRVKAEMIRSHKFPTAKIEIDDSWVIKDEAKTGRVTREGYEIIKNGVSTKSFDMLLVDDISRTTRDMGDTIDLFEALSFSGIEGFSVADNISTEDANARDLFIFKGYANEHQSKATSKNTCRGLEVRVLGGFSTGHIPYGFCSTPTKTTIIKGIEKPSHFGIRIDQAEALVVIRIWTMFGIDNLGQKAIARILNEEDVPPPRGRGQNGKQSDRWSDKTIWKILTQKKYVGIWEYRKTKTVKNPDTNKLVQKPRPKSEWLVTEREDLRIIPADLEKIVKEKRGKIELTRLQAKGKGEQIFGSSGAKPAHLFLGSLKCGVCGGNMVQTSGKNGGYLGCMNAHRETSVTCNNKKTMRLLYLEWNLVEELKKSLDCPQTYEYLATKYNEKMKEQGGEIPKRLLIVEDQIVEIERAIKNYDKFIKEGHWSDIVVKNLAESEAKLKSLNQEKSTLIRHCENKIFVTPGAIKQRMADLNEILNLKVSAANAIIRQLIPAKVTLNPLTVDNKCVYCAEGAFNLYSLMKFRLVEFGVPTGIRTPVAAVKGRCPRPG